MDSHYQRMTSGSIPKLVVSLALPTIASMVVTALYNTADTFFVSKLGTSAIGAVGIVFSLMAIIQAVGFMFGMGSGSFISRSLGAQDVKTANEYAASAFYASIAVGGLITLFGLMFIDDFMLVLGSTETILPYSKSYGSYILFGAPVMCASFTMNNILRAEGMASLAMRGLVSGGIINIILDPIFIFTLGYGIAGAAIATLLSQCISFSILLSFFIRRKSTVRLGISNISRRIKPYTDIIKLGSPSLLRQGLASVSTIALNVSAAVYSDAAVAGMSVVARIFMFLMSVILGLGQGFMPVAGYNYGGKLYSRVKQAFWFSVKCGLCSMALLSSSIFIFAEQVIGFFSNDPAVLAVAIPAIRFQCITLLVQPFFMYTNMLHQATGFAARAAFLACNRQGIYFLPAVIILPVLFGLSGVILIQPTADLLSFLTAIPFLVIFMRRLDANAKQNTVNLENIEM